MSVKHNKILFCLLLYKVLLCLADTSLYIYMCVKHFGMANIKEKKRKEQYILEIMVSTSLILNDFNLLESYSFVLKVSRS